MPHATLQDGSIEWLSDEELNAAETMFNMLLDGTLYEETTMNIVDYVDQLREMSTHLTEKGYKGTGHYTAFNDVDMTFNTSFNFEDEYGKSTRMRAYIVKNDAGDEQTWDIPLARCSEAMNNLFDKVRAVPSWGKVKRERALANMRETITELQDMGEEFFSEEEQKMILMIKERAEALASNALAAPSD